MKASPVNLSERAHILDVLRGFALLGYLFPWPTLHGYVYIGIDQKGRPNGASWRL